MQIDEANVGQGAIDQEHIAQEDMGSQGLSKEFL